MKKENKNTEQVSTTTTKEVKKFVKSRKDISYQRLLYLGYLMESGKLPIVDRMSILESRHEEILRKLNRLIFVITKE